MKSSALKWEWIGALLFSLVCASLWFRPVFWEMASDNTTPLTAIWHIFFSNESDKMLLGAGVDFVGTIWIISQVDSILFGGQETILDGIFSPTGFDLGVHTGFAWADAALASPLLRWIGFPGFYNLHLFLSLMLSQCALIALFRTAKAPIAVSWGLSAAVMLHPFMYDELYMGRPTQTHLVFHALFLLSVLKIRAHKKAYAWGIFGGLALTAACLTYWFSGVAIGFMAAIIVLIDLRTGKWKRKRIGAYLILSFTAIVSALVLSYRAAAPWLTGQESVFFPQYERPPAMTIWTPIVDIPIQKIIRIDTIYDLLGLIEDVQLPMLFLILGGLSIVALCLKPKAWPWALGGIAAIGLPIGPAIAWNTGWIVNSHAILQGVFPPLIRCENPERMVTATILLLSLGFVMAVFPLRKGSKSVQFLLQIGMGMGLAAYALQQAPTHADARYHAFSPEPFILEQSKLYPGGIIDVPLIASEKTYVQQLYHQQPILGGPGQNRVQPKAHKDFVEQNTFLNSLEALASNGKIEAYDNNDANTLFDLGFRLIIIEKNQSQATLNQFEKLIGSEGDAGKKSRYMAIPLKRKEK